MEWAVLLPRQIVPQLAAHTVPPDFVIRGKENHQGGYQHLPHQYPIHLPDKPHSRFWITFQREILRRKWVPFLGGPGCGIRHFFCNFK